MAFRVQEPSGGERARKFDLARGLPPWFVPDAKVARFSAANGVGDVAFEEEFGETSGLRWTPRRRLARGGEVEWFAVQLGFRAERFQFWVGFVAEFSVSVGKSEGGRAEENAQRIRQEFAEEEDSGAFGSAHVGSHVQKMRLEKRAEGGRSGRAEAADAKVGEGKGDEADKGVSAVAVEWMRNRRLQRKWRNFEMEKQRGGPIGSEPRMAFAFQKNRAGFC